MREDEFSPLKNAPGVATDSPQTCRDSLMELHYRQVLAAGGVVSDDNGTSVSRYPVCLCYLLFFLLIFVYVFCQCDL